MKSAARAMALSLIVALLSGCVSFQVAPVSSMVCDATLVGHWLPEDAKPEDRPLRATDHCDVFSEDSRGRAERGHFSTFEFDGHQYLAVEADTSLDVVDAGGNIVEVWPKTRIELFRYRHEGDRLMLWAASAKVAQTLEGNSATVHTDDIIDPETNKPMPRKTENNVYIVGNHLDIAMFLREHGDALYSAMTPEKAITLRRSNMESTQ